MLRTKYDAEQLADELVNISGIPEPVATAHRGFVALRDLRATQQATVAGAWADAIADLVDAAGRDDQRDLVATIDLSAVDAARARDADSEVRARLLREAVPAAGGRFADVVIAHEHDVVRAIQAAHAGVVKKMFAAINIDPTISEEPAIAARGDEAKRWLSIRDDADELGRLRRLLALVTREQQTAEMNYLGWVRSSLVRDAWLRPVPGEPPTSFGTPGAVEFWCALVRAGVTPEQVWLPIPSEVTALAEELTAAEVRERAQRAVLPRTPLRSL